MGYGILAPLVCTVETNKLISVLLGLYNWKYVYNMFWILRFITLAVTVCLMMFQRVCKINENSSIYVSFLIDEHDLLKEIPIFFLAGCGIWLHLRMREILVIFYPLYLFFLLTDFVIWNDLNFYCNAGSY